MNTCLDRSSRTDESLDEYGTKKGKDGDTVKKATASYLKATTLT